MARAAVERAREVRSKEIYGVDRWLYLDQYEEYEIQGERELKERVVSEVGGTITILDESQQDLRLGRVLSAFANIVPTTDDQELFFLEAF